MPLVVQLFDYFSSRGLLNLFLIALDLAVGWYLQLIAKKKLGPLSRLPQIVLAMYRQYDMVLV